ncbi:MAG: thiolase domain-containing protein [Polyangiales bacterium]
MRDVAIVSFAQTSSRRTDLDETEMLLPVVTEAVVRSGIPRREIGFTCSGSCDYLGGRPFSFVMAIDAIGAWPPIEESHVEMDGAWALYEAWVRLQHGDLDAALVYAFGKSSQGDLPDVMVQQLDPYYVAPLWPDSVSLAALQARAMLDAGRCTERDLAEIAIRNRRNAMTNPYAHASGEARADDLLAEPYLVAPLRRHDCPPITDAAAAIVLVAGERARAVHKRPAWIRGIDHRIDSHSLGLRDLTKSPSTSIAAERAGVAKGKVDIAELHAPFTHQELILKTALGLDDSVVLNPSGGALGAHALMVAGLTRIGEAARRIHDGSATRAVAHATSGPCLQQNLVCVLEGE